MKVFIKKLFLSISSVFIILLAVLSIIFFYGLKFSSSVSKAFNFCKQRRSGNDE